VPQTILSRVAAGTGALTTAKSVIALTANTTVEPESKAIPDYATLDKVECEITTIAGGAVSVIWNLAKDAAGDYAITPETTSTIVLGKTDTTKGGIAALIDSDEVKSANQVAGTIYLVARTGVGTATITKALLYWTP
jgi:hypothetical protein